MGVQELLIWWADPSAASLYGVEHLSADDTIRARAIRSGKALRDWQVSRALLHHVRGAQPEPGATSLSHSGGHALLATAPPGWKVGADLEATRPRNVDGLAQWVCSQAERDLLATLPEDARLLRFYQLWTLKEAFIKAAGLEFPADMASVGLNPMSTGLALRPPAGRWAACSYRAGAGWMASVVWQAPDASACDMMKPAWRGAAGCALPGVESFGQWRTDTA
ncbi:4'-phosphopantetheinyl transferase family protein [Achromobacter spanius]|uniref:4-diphosphocytidyl-2C-methyl-D-erythritol kinase n=1 Tax=Achromobacter spanius TaxID=217203 RepID=A0A2S0I5Z7_9BURK|nr:4'-phosphopantetheinyl transferase superfamily protein [Achromobacter spanius]AVJ27413.1 4-diphosphocytidyl-2C-methyl-D-erythritol kinase [Achromobacter spanius]